MGALIGIPVGGALQVVVREIRRGPDAMEGRSGDERHPSDQARIYRISRVRPLVIIPTYNEAENIERILRRIAESLPEAGVLVVDDGSPDGTGDLVKAMAAELPDIHLLARTEKGGLGSAYRAGFVWGLEHGYDVLVEMDADFSHDPGALPACWPRSTRASTCPSGPATSRAAPSPTGPATATSSPQGGNRYASAVLGLKVSDSTAGFRAYRPTSCASSTST